MSFSRALRVLPFLFVLMTLAACAKHAPRPDAAQTHQAPGQEQQAPVRPAPPLPAAPPLPTTTETEKSESACLECETAEQNQDRDTCFKLQPGRKSKNSKGKTVIGRCQPQCIPYARCRSGIMTCRLGDTSPVGWFQCAKKNKDTTSTPKAGSLMVIDVNTRHNMATGHLGYVEEACPNADGTWRLRFSHTNYDRKCHLDLDAEVLFNPKTMTATFLSGPWKPWAKNLKICGFILR